MEFTTRFGLHSQTTRLWEDAVTRRPVAAMGLTPAPGKGLDQKDAGDRPTAP